MTRRPLLVGALVALVGAALLIFVMQRGADPVSATSEAPRTSPTPSRMSTMSTTSTASATTTPSVTATPTATPSASSAATSSAGSLSRATAEPPQVAAPRASGIELVIPGIGLHKRLHAEGLRGGKINPPAGTVMWFTGSNRVRPGQVGTAVIAGHVVSRGSGDAFARLADVGVGDRIRLTGTGGGVDTYRVVRAGVVDKDALTTDQAVWGSNSSVRRLAIITCDDARGFRSDGHRVANYVVIAEPA